MAPVLPKLASALLPHGAHAVLSGINNAHAIDAAILSSLVAAVDDLRPDDCPDVGTDPPELLAPELVAYVVTPWSNMVALALAERAVGAFSKKTVGDATMQDLARELADRWMPLSGGQQSGALADEQWRAKVAVRTVDLLPRMLAKILPGEGSAARLFEMLIASKTTGLGRELEARAGATVGSGAPEAPAHPPHTTGWRSAHEPCHFEITHRFADRHSAYWTKLADVRIEVAEHTGKVPPYLIPSFSAPFVLRTPGWFQSHQTDFDMKRRLTEEFCAGHMHRKLSGWLFTMISLKHGPVPRVYCAAYDDHLTNGYLKAAG